MVFASGLGIDIGIGDAVCEDYRHRRAHHESKSGASKRQFDMRPSAA
jgi:hypothetical protein